jgi:hypothetical protein
MRDAIIETIAAEIDAACEEANLGCGLVYELFARRFQSACDALLAKVPRSTGMRRLGSRSCGAIARTMTPRRHFTKVLVR